MIILGAVAFRTVVSANSMAPAVSVQLSPCAILAFIGIGVPSGGVTSLIFTVVPSVELQLIHDPIEFCFHLAVDFVILDV